MAMYLKSPHLLGDKRRILHKFGKGSGNHVLHEIVLWCKTTLLMLSNKGHAFTLAYNAFDYMSVA